MVDAGGVGYKLTISGTTYSALPHSTASEAPKVKLYSHLSVREDGVELFGFATLEELNLFRLLLSVSGVGPKAAISILTQLTPEKLALAVCTEDKKQISKAPGVGPKTAARIILELKDKVSKQDVAAGVKGSPIPVVAAASNTVAEAVSALMVLGYTNTEATNALSGLDPASPADELIKAGLKKLARF